MMQTNTNFTSISLTLDANLTLSNGSFAPGGNEGSSGLLSSGGPAFLPPPPPGGPGHAITPLFDRPMLDLIVVDPLQFNFSSVLERIVGIKNTFFSAPPSVSPKQELGKVIMPYDFSLLDGKASKSTKYDLAIPEQTFQVYILGRGKEGKKDEKRTSKLGQQFLSFGFVVQAQDPAAFYDGEEVPAAAASPSAPVSEPPASEAAAAGGAAAAAQEDRPSSVYGFGEGVRTSVVLENGELVVKERPPSGFFGFEDEDEGAATSEVREGPAATGKRLSKLEAVEEDKRVETVATILASLGDHAAGAATLEALAQWVDSHVPETRRLSQMGDPSQNQAERAGFSPSELASLYRGAESFGLTHDLIQTMRRLTLTFAQIDQLEGVMTLLHFPEKLQTEKMQLDAQMRARLQEVFTRLVQRLLYGDLMSFFVREQSEGRDVARGEVFKLLMEQPRFKAELVRIGQAEYQRKQHKLEKEYQVSKAREIEEMKAPQQKAKGALLIGKTGKDLEAAREKLATMNEAFQKSLASQMEAFDEEWKAKREALANDYSHVNS